MISRDPFPSRRQTRSRLAIRSRTIALLTITRVGQHGELGQALLGEGSARPALSSLHLLVVMLTTYSTTHEAGSCIWSYQAQFSGDTSRY